MRVNRRDLEVDFCVGIIRFGFLFFNYLNAMFIVTLLNSVIMTVGGIVAFFLPVG